MSFYLVDHDATKLPAVRELSIWEFFMALDKKIGRADAGRDNKLQGAGKRPG